MENRKQPTESEVIGWLKAGRVELPPMRFTLLKIQPRYDRGSPWDFELEGRWADRKARFAVEYKGLSTPQSFEGALRQCRDASLPGGKLPLVVLPYLRPSQLEELERLGVSGIDLCGNGVVIVPGAIRIYRTGADNRFTTSAPIKNIYRKNTSMVARLFTARPTFPNVQSICEEVNRRNPFVQVGSRTPMRLGTVSKALKGLEEDLILERGEEIRLLQSEKLLAQLAENYETPQVTRKRGIRVQQQELRLGVTIGKRIQGARFAVAATGLSSTRKYAASVGRETIELYCSSLDDLQERLEGKETGQFPNVELLEVNDESYFFDTILEQGFPWASPIQTYLELMAGDKRDQETADQVKAILMRNMKRGLS